MEEGILGEEIGRSKEFEVRKFREQGIGSYTIWLEHGNCRLGGARRKWQPTPVFLPGESQGRGSLVGCRLWGHTESDTTEVT